MMALTLLPRRRDPLTGQVVRLRVTSGPVQVAGVAASLELVCWFSEWGAHQVIALDADGSAPG